jgi:hypothetical protein
MVQGSTSTNINQRLHNIYTANVGTTRNYSKKM